MITDLQNRTPASTRAVSAAGGVGNRTLL